MLSTSSVTATPNTPSLKASTRSMPIRVSSGSTLCWVMSAIVVVAEDLLKQRPDPGALRDQHICALVDDWRRIIGVKHALVNVLCLHVLEIQADAQQLIEREIAACVLAD